jgi:hypothetical protein
MNSGDFEKDILRRTAFWFYNKEEFPTENKIALQLTDTIYYNGFASSIFEFLKALNSNTRKSKMGANFSMKRGDIVAARIKFHGRVHNLKTWAPRILKMMHIFGYFQSSISLKTEHFGSWLCFRHQVVWNFIVSYFRYDHVECKWAKNACKNCVLQYWLHLSNLVIVIRGSPLASLEVKIETFEHSAGSEVNVTFK